MKRSNAPVIVFRVAAPLAAGSRIAEGGSSAASASSSGLAQPPAVRKRRLAAAGVRTTKAPLVARVGRERAWFFYADRAPFKAFEHAGQVVLVGVRSGKVRTTRILSWPPLVDGRLPAFMRTAQAYRSKANRIFYRPWQAAAAQAQASPAGAGAFAALAAPSLISSGAAQRAADMLALQKACAVRISDTLGDFYDFGNIDSTRARLGSYFDGLAAMNHGFRTVRYSTYSNRTPTGFVANAIKSWGCKQLVLYVAGGGVHQPRGSTASTAVIGTLPHADGTLDSQTLGSGQLQQLVRAFPGVSFSIIVDAPYSGGFVSALGKEPNVAIVMSPVAGQGAFNFLPEFRKSGELLPNPGNPDGLLEFTNRLLTGLDRFFDNPAETDTASSQNVTGFLAWMFARAFLDSSDADFPAGVPNGSDPQVNTNFNASPQQTGSGAPPFANDQSVSTPEDTSVPVTLSGFDPGDKGLVYAIADGPAHGTLSGTAPDLTYTPGANFNGADSFTFTVSNGHFTSRAGTVAISVSPVNDAPVLTGIESNPLGYIDGAPGVPITSTIALADVDNSTAAGAVVSVASGYHAGDQLAFTNGSGISGSFNSSTGTLTLSGAASDAVYQAAMRSVSFQSTGTPTGSRTISFQVDDGSAGGLSNVASRTVTVDNAPTDITLTPSNVDENLPGGTAVGTLAATDPDAGDTQTFTLVGGTGSADNGLFQVNGSTLETASPLNYEASGTRSIRVRADDGHGGTFEKVLTVTVNDRNDAPTDIAVSTSTVAENLPSGTTVGTLSTTDEDPGDSHTYTLVTGTGDDDNASFTISGTQLQTAASFDYEAKSSYSIRVQADDGHGGTFEKQLPITVTNANDAPTDIALTPSAVAENQPSGTAVGTLSSSDQDAGDSHAYTLVTGTGDDDNASFSISGTTLETTASFDYETKSSYSIRVQTDDGHGGTFDKQLTVNVTDANDVPTDISLSSSTVPENQPSGTTVGTLLTADQDAGDSHNYTLVTGTGDDDNAQFTISGDQLKTAATFDFEAKSSYSIRVKTDDTHGGTLEKQLTVNVTDANDAPTDVALSNANVDENQPSGTAVGTLSSIDQDSGDSHVYSLVSGTGSADNASFAINGNGLQTGASFNYEVKKTYSVRVQTDDTHGGTFSKQFTIDVNDVNDPPVDGNETVSAVGNTLLEYGSSASSSTEPKKFVSGNLLANATDEDVPANTLSVSAFDATSAHGGTVDVTPDGTFIYRPAAGFSGADTFGYTVSDGQGGTANSTVTANVGPRVWYVKNDANVSGADGTSGHPFTTLGQADSAANAANDITFVYKGDGTSYGSNFSLLSGQQLLGEAAGLTVGGSTLLPANSANRPKISGNITLASGSRAQGLDIAGSGGPAIAGGNSGGSDVSDVNLSGASGGVSLSGASGIFNFTKVAITTTGGTGFAASGSSTTLNLGSGSTQDTISATGGSGLVLNNLNSASSTTLDNLSATGTGSASAVSVANAGTLTIGGTGNVLNSGSGGALSVQSTTIGATGLTFQSVASTGATSGIVLSGTGNSGGLTVSGSGGTCTTSANCSGGAIVGSSAAGISLTNVGGGVNLTRMDVSGGNSDGVHGATVSGFSLASSVIASNGSAGNGDGLSFTELTGTATFDTDAINANQVDGLRIVNSTGALTANVTNGSVSNQNTASIGDDGILVNATGGGSQTLNVQGTSFSANRGDHIQVNDAGTSSATQNVTINNTTMTSPPSGVLGGGITISPAGAANVTTHVTNNNITGAVSSAINHNFVSGTGTMQATITGNTTTSPGADGVQVYTQGTATSTALVANNTLQTYNFAGIDLLQGDGNGTLNATVRGNVISNPGANAESGLYAQLGSLSGDAGTSCVSVGDPFNAAFQNSLGATMGSVGGVADIRLRQRFGVTVRLPGYTGANTDGAAAGSYLVARNPSGPPSVSATAIAPGFVNGGAACPVPS